MGLIALIILVSLLTSSPHASSSSASAGFRVDLTHVDRARGYSRTELLKRAAERSKARAAKLASPNFGPVSIHPSNGEYLMDLAIGTPPLHFRGILDTGSNLIWTQCKPCMECMPQPSPLFDPLRSPSFSPLPCSHKLCRTLSLLNDSACAPNCLYHVHYGDGTNSVGFMGTETFTFGTTKKVRIPGLGFGCGVYNSGDMLNSSGMVGFGRGPVSLLSQLGVTDFSYCFTNSFAGDSDTSPLFFGKMARLAGPKVRTTPLIALDPSGRHLNYFHLSLNGITVGDTLLPIPPQVFHMNKDGSGGMIIDSGTTNLLLQTAIYKPFVAAFRSQIKAHAINTTDLAYELCYSLSSLPDEIPGLVFHFQDADWEMPVGNYFLPNGKIACLAATESPVGLSIFGNFQTQNMHVWYDLKNNKLSFMPATCSKI